ncbi:Crp/Fnr family transcriptional regulator [Methylobacterium dankookense]|uniref:CRP-like cAMP-activated global transcriptional regulator n=1 Tax=Methylobacterium dankookense TaxID=560405 RepID=A0A564G1D2_9HYPH|nr:Crp/Fnr family transcriptional regulator [Methylobacterium dankookense]GJD54806.1 CRP-like cAMP-activated global transcriptional regulator [Methylobacterium dankookense]VUF14279.1 CRP-like cAMP-activated global transcriptional regulator [Methylobacterium dankookense]
MSPSLVALTVPPRAPAPLIVSALFLSESTEGLDEGAGFLDGLGPADVARLRAAGRTLTLAPGQSVFRQGEPHAGIFLIDEGRVRVFYTGPSGRQITLAYWTPGHFIGGPSLTGGGSHQWSGEAIEACRVTALSAPTLRSLIRQMPDFALCLIEALEAKGRCYTAMAQMLGTRSVIERLAQLLLNLGDLYGREVAGARVIERRITHDELAALIGSTRQWVTMMLKRFQADGIVAVDKSFIRITRPERLAAIVQAAQ